MARTGAQGRGQCVPTGQVEEVDSTEEIARRPYRRKQGRTQEIRAGPGGGGGGRRYEAVELGIRAGPGGGAWGKRLEAGRLEGAQQE